MSEGNAWQQTFFTTAFYECFNVSLTDLQLQDQHQGGRRLVRVQQRHQLVILDALEDVRLMSHLLLLLHLLTDKLHRHLNRKKTIMQTHVQAISSIYEVKYIA